MKWSVPSRHSIASAPGWLWRINSPNTGLHSLSQIAQYGAIALDFFRVPEQHPLVEDIQRHLENWLGFRTVGTLNPRTIASRFPDFFVWGLHLELQSQTVDYTPLISAIETPVVDAWRRTRTWEAYRRDLKRQLAEPVFGESFSLAQIFIWPLAFTEVRETTTEKETSTRKQAAAGMPERQCTRQVFDLKDSLDHWISGEGCSEEEQRRDAVRVISGDPGSGKSSFSRMFADHRIDEGDNVLFVPLHRLNVQGEFGNEIDVFCGETDNCPTGLMTAEAGASRLLVILDGLDELAKQGAIGATIANAFVEEVLRKVSARNSNELRIRVIISGRPIAIQNVGDKFRRPGQIYTVLPYFIEEEERNGFTGRTDLLSVDLRQEWWKKYGELTGHVYEGLPADLGSPELMDLTTQPLLNLLLAIVYQHGEPSSSEHTIDFSGTVNRNMIYDVLLERVYERDWDTTKSHKALGDLKPSDFKELLEEMALTAWHGTERTTTVSALREQCNKNYLKGVLEQYEMRCDDGVGSLFTAFYFRKSEKTDGPEPTFEFTHKSFGEYLTALRIVDGLKEIDDQLNEHKTARRRINTFSDEDALIAWLELFGPTPISQDLLPYIQNEVSRRLQDATLAERWQDTLVRLLDSTIAHGMPCEKLSGNHVFRRQQQLSSNAEVALFTFHSLVAELTDRVSKIAWQSPGGAESLLERYGTFRISNFLNHLNFDGQMFWRSLLFHANLKRSSFKNATFHFTSCVATDFTDADFSDADLYGVRLEGAVLVNANMKSARLKTVFFGGHHSGRPGSTLCTSITGADLSQCKIDLVAQMTSGIPAFLPDGEKPGTNWTRELEMAREEWRKAEAERELEEVGRTEG